MPEAVILEFTGIGLTEYEAVNKELGIDMTTGVGDWANGLMMHCGGTADDGKFVVTEVWESRELQGAFLESRLGAALGAVACRRSRTGPGFRCSPSICRRVESLTDGTDPRRGPEETIPVPRVGD